MTPRCAILSLALLIFSFNVSAGTNNPVGEAPTESVTVNQKTTSTKTEDRKLSRKERKERLRRLSERYHEFLTSVEPVITPDEVTAFLLLDTDAQRDYFIERFWLIRDSDPATPRNEYRERYEELLLEAKELFKYMSSDRARIYLTHGRPADMLDIRCP
ncbi:MAG: GWxTD domain-containing protein, partial [Acidobacteria bacterium]|nr:GWxTD domain-containing protein [Acidobacteriota bacterium]